MREAAYPISQVKCLKLREKNDHHMLWASLYWFKNGISYTIKLNGTQIFADIHR